MLFPRYSRERFLYKSNICNTVTILHLTHVEQSYNCTVVYVRLCNIVYAHTVNTRAEFFCEDEYMELVLRGLFQVQKRVFLLLYTDEFYIDVIFGINCPKAFIHLLVTL